MKKTRYTILIMFCSIILNNSLAQTYELQKIANLLPNDAHFNFFQLQSAGNGFSIKNSWAVNGSKTENQIYEGLGNTWAIHSNYTNAFLWMRNVFKTNDNNVWALANTEPVSAPPGHNDTTYLMKFENNKWTKVKQLAVYPMGSANYGAYNFPNYNFNAHDNLHYFFIKD